MYIYIYIYDPDPDMWSWVDVILSLVVRETVHGLRSISGTGINTAVPIFL